jgi:hypothetical protein
MLLLIRQVSKLKRASIHDVPRLQKKRPRFARSKRRDERPQQGLTDRLDRDCIMVRLRLYPILFVHVGTPAIIATDSHLLMVQLQFDEISAHDLVIMPGILQVLVRVIVGDELQHCVGSESYSGIARIRQLYPTHIRPIAVQLWEKIGMVELTDCQFIASYLGAGLSIPMCFVRTPPVPGDVLQIAS